MSYPLNGGHQVVPHRACAARVEAPGCRPFVAYSLYLYDGKGLTKPNLDMLAAVGGHVDAQGDETQFVIGGDFQIEPSTIANAGFADSIDATLYASGDPRGTCRTARSKKELDYVFVSCGLGKAVNTISTINEGLTRPHVPVQLEFRPRITSQRQLTLRRPHQLPTVRVHGPINEPAMPDWSKLRRTAATLARDAVTEEVGQVQRRLDDLFSQWADAAEVELQLITGKTVPKPGLRGKQPVLRWKSVVPERPTEQATTSASAWRWLLMAAADLKRIHDGAANSYHYDYGNDTTQMDSCGATPSSMLGWRPRRSTTPYTSLQMPLKPTSEGTNARQTYAIA